MCKLTGSGIPILDFQKSPLYEKSLLFLSWATVASVEGKTGWKSDSARASGTSGIIAACYTVNTAVELFSNLLWFQGSLIFLLTTTSWL